MSNEKPNLGLATTRELLQEIKARGEVEHDQHNPQTLYFATWMARTSEAMLVRLPKILLDYKTVDHD